MLAGLYMIFQANHQLQLSGNNTMSTPKIDKQKKILIVGAAKSGNLGAVAMASSLLLFLKNQGYSANNIGLSRLQGLFLT